MMAMGGAVLWIRCTVCERFLYYPPAYVVNGDPVCCECFRKRYVEERLEKLLAVARLADEYAGRPGTGWSEKRLVTALREWREFEAKQAADSAALGPHSDCVEVAK